MMLPPASSQVWPISGVQKSLELVVSQRVRPMQCVQATQPGEHVYPWWGGTCPATKVAASHSERTSTAGVGALHAHARIMARQTMDANVVLDM